MTTYRPEYKVFEGKKMMYSMRDSKNIYEWKASKGSLYCFKKFIAKVK